MQGQVICSSCYAGTAVLEDCEEAKKEWNNRTQNQKLREALEEIVDLYSKYDEGGMISQGKTMKRIAQQALDEVGDKE